MAINLTARYPGKVGLANADYPTGEPRNVSADEAGDGTPWDELLIKDFIGFRDAALAQAGEAANNVPETAQDSQVLRAVRKGLVAQVSNLRALTLSPLSNGQQYSVKGFYENTDVGGGLFYYDASRDKADHNGGTVIDPERLAAWDGTQSDLATLFTAGSGSGCFVRLSAPPTAKQEVRLSWFGATHTAADNAVAFSQVGTALADFTGALVSEGGDFLTTGALQIPRNADFITLAPTTIDGSTGTSFAAGAVVSKTGSPPAPRPNLASDVVAGGKGLSFVAPHGLTVGELILIYNPSDFSYSASRDYYRAGEFCEVESVVSSTEVTLKRPLYDDYLAADVGVYSCSDFATGKIGRVRAIAPDSSVNAIRLDFTNGVELDQPFADQSGAAAFSIAHSYDVKGVAQARQASISSGLGTYYGLVITNSQQIDLSGAFAGYRHGITTGGGPTFSVPCREIHVHNFFASNQVGNIAAADWHGNTEHSSYKNGQCFTGGLNLAGHKNTISGVTVKGDADGICVLGRELKSLEHTIEGCHFSTLASDNLRGVCVDVGGDSIPFGANTEFGGTLTIRNCRMEAPNQVGSTVRVRNRGFVGEWFLVVDGVDFAGHDSPSFGSVNVATVSGDTPAGVQVTDISRSPKPLGLGSVDLAADVPVRQSSVSFSAELDLLTSEAIKTQAFSFPIVFSKVPDVTAALNGAASTGTDHLYAGASAPSSSGVSLYIKTIDGANFGAAATRRVAGAAELNEW